ncbi:hypothetical protein [Kribbella sp. NPDC055071]
MSPDQEDYAGLLKALRESPDEALEGISVDRAVRDGRRTVRRRRFLGGVGVAAVVGAVSASPLLLDALRDDKAQPAGPPPGSTELFDVWNREFDVGTAGGVAPSAYTTGRRFQVIELTATDPTKSAGVDGVATLYAPGTHADLSTVDRLQDIEGRPVYAWTDASGVHISWQYADNAWGTVVLYVNWPDRTDRARHIAEAIHRRKNPARLRVPFTLSQDIVPNDFKVVGVRLPYVTPDASRNISIDLADADPDDPAAGSALVSVGIVRADPHLKTTGKVDGRPALVEANSAIILGLGSGYAAQAAGADALSPKSIAASVRLISDPAKQSLGTDDPIR